MKYKDRKRVKTLTKQENLVDEVFQHQLESVGNEAIRLEDSGPFAKWCERKILRHYHLRAPEGAYSAPTDTFFAW